MLRKMHAFGARGILYTLILYKLFGFFVGIILTAVVQGVWL